MKYVIYVHSKKLQRGYIVKCYFPFRGLEKSEEYARELKKTKGISITLLMTPKPVPIRLDALSFGMKERIAFPHYF